jgi:hypothetical protein
LIQKGIGVELEPRYTFPTITIISCCSWIVATIIEKGQLLEQCGLVSSLFGMAPVLFNPGVHPLLDGNPEEESLIILADLLRKEGVSPELRSA